MKLISHRGNTHYRQSPENSLISIDQALNSGYDVEVDVWNIYGSYFLGHDSPDLLVNKTFLLNEKLWCHAKNLAALESMLDDGIHCFWHQEDDFTLTSRGFIWTYPNKDITSKSVIVCQTLNEYNQYINKNIYGVCSDFVGAI